jgi:hypothetical protein
MLHVFSQQLELLPSIGMAGTGQSGRSKTGGGGGGQGEAAKSVHGH